LEYPNGFQNLPLTLFIPSYRQEPQNITQYLNTVYYLLHL